MEETCSKCKARLCPTCKKPLRYKPEYVDDGDGYIDEMGGTWECEDYCELAKPLPPL